MKLHNRPERDRNEHYGMEHYPEPRHPETPAPTPEPSSMAPAPEVPRKPHGGGAPRMEDRKAVKDKLRAVRMSQYQIDEITQAAAEEGVKFGTYLNRLIQKDIDRRARAAQRKARKKSS